MWNISHYNFLDFFLFGDMILCYYHNNCQYIVIEIVRLLQLQREEARLELKRGYGTHLPHFNQWHFFYIILLLLLLLLLLWYIYFFLYFLTISAQNSLNDYFVNVTLSVFSSLNLLHLSINVTSDNDDER